MPCVVQIFIDTFYIIIIMQNYVRDILSNKRQVFFNTIKWRW